MFALAFTSAAKEIEENVHFFSFPLYVILIKSTIVSSIKKRSSNDKKKN